MLSPHASDAYEIGRVGFLPPIEFYRICYFMVSKQSSIAQAANETRVMFLLKPDESWDVQMIVMIMTQEHDIDWRQIFKP